LVIENIDNPKLLHFIHPYVVAADSIRLNTLELILRSAIKDKEIGFSSVSLAISKAGKPRSMDANLIMEIAYRDVNCLFEDVFDAVSTARRMTEYCLFTLSSIAIEDEEC